MKFNPGDRVTIIDSNDSGVVVDVMETGVVLVDVDGFAIPVQEVDLVKYGFEKLPTQPAENTSISVGEKGRGADTGIHTGFVPQYVDGHFSHFKFSLLNDMPCPLAFSFEMIIAGRQRFHLSERVLATHSSFYLADLMMEELNDAPQLVFHLQMLKDNRKIPVGEKILKPKAKTLFGTQTILPLLQETGILSILYKEKKTGLEKEVSAPVAIDVDYLKERLQSNTDSGKNYEIGNADEVIDLHIEVLLPHEHEHLSKEMKLKVQLDAFVRGLERAISHGLNEFVVIHGRGSGRLRSDVHEILKQNYPSVKFENKYDSRFGFGATFIRI